MLHIRPSQRLTISISHPSPTWGRMIEVKLDRGPARIPSFENGAGEEQVVR